MVRWFKNTSLDWLRPKIFRLAGVKTLLMPYGGDVQDLRYTTNLKFKNAMTKDYPLHRIPKVNLFLLKLTHGKMELILSYQVVTG